MTTKDKIARRKLSLLKVASDLRHSHASHAIMNGESLHMAGRLLGHRRAATTNRYAHLDDVTLSKAAERVAKAIERKVTASI